MTHTFLGSSPFDLKEWGMSKAQALGVPGWLMYMEALQESWDYTKVWQENIAPFTTSNEKPGSPRSDIYPPAPEVPTPQRMRSGCTTIRFPGGVSGGGRLCCFE